MVFPFSPTAMDIAEESAGKRANLPIRAFERAASASPRFFALIREIS
jgi:hypothetical protein